MEAAAKKRWLKNLAGNQKLPQLNKISPNSKKSLPTDTNLT